MDSKGQVDIKVKLNGIDFQDADKVLNISTYSEINRVASAQLLIFDGDASDENFKISSSDSFLPGGDIEIWVGYESNLSLIFKGIIIKQSLKIKENRSSFLQVECKDKAVQLTLTPQFQTFQDSTDSSVFEEILLSNNLESIVEPTEVIHETLIQNNLSNWDFIVTRSEMNGLLVSTSKNKITIFKPTVLPEASTTLKYGETIYEFEAGMDARNQFEAVKAHSWFPGTQEVIEANSTPSSLETQGNISPLSLASAMGSNTLDLHHSGQLPQDELDSWVNASLMRQRLSKITGRVKCQGNATLEVSATIKLDGLGSRFDGNAFISGVRHEISQGNWMSHVQLGLDKTWFSNRVNIQSQLASGMLAGFSGLQTGIVKNLEDPTGNERILVRIPTFHQEETSEGVWARLATLDAGLSKGSYFLPDLEDEVIIGFTNGDPRNPVILGKMYSASKIPPLTATNDNFQKGFFTRGQLKLVFDDDQNSILIETISGQKIYINDQDDSLLIENASDNKISLSKDGITLESSGDIQIKASGSIVMQAANIEQNASSKISTSATDIDQEAKASLKASANASLSVSSSGTTTVKGSIVKIN